MTQDFVRSSQLASIQFPELIKQILRDRSSKDRQLVLTADKEGVLLHGMHEPLIRKADILKLSGLEIKPLNVEQKPRVLVRLKYLTTDLVIVDLSENKLLWRSLDPIGFEEVVGIKHAVATLGLVWFSRGSEGNHTRIYAGIRPLFRLAKYTDDIERETQIVLTQLV